MVTAYKSILKDANGKVIETFAGPSLMAVMAQIVDYQDEHYDSWDWRDHTVEYHRDNVPVGDSEVQATWVHTYTRDPDKQIACRTFHTRITEAIKWLCYSDTGFGDYRATIAEYINRLRKAVRLLHDENAGAGEKFKAASWCGGRMMNACSRCGTVCWTGYFSAHEAAITCSGCGKRVALTTDKLAPSETVALVVGKWDSENPSLKVTLQRYRDYLQRIQSKDDTTPEQWREIQELLK